MDTKLITDLITQHKWYALAALLIGLTVRLLKSDGPIPINVPAKWRAPLALGLGVLAGVLDKVGTGETWQNAIATGIAAAVTAIVGHVLIVESARGGREIGESKAAFARRSLRPPPMPPSDSGNSPVN